MGIISAVLVVQVLECRKLENEMTNNNMSFYNNLTVELEKILHHQAGPYLFVGAGISRRYAGLPDWLGLLNEFALYTEKPIEYYLGGSESDLSKAAGLIAEDFFEVWWNDPKFLDSRLKYREVAAKDRRTPLKIEVSKFISDKIDSLHIAPDLQEEFDAFSQIKIDAIITTNYDSLLSDIFSDFHVFVGQEELLFANPQGVAEIYQIHGSVKSPSSLVLTGEDYADFSDRNAYLAAKLVTVFMEHPIIFLGYSLSDSNIIQILRSILHGIRSENIERLKSRLIFVEWTPDEPASINSDSFFNVDDVSLPITRIKTDNFTWIYEALAKRTRALPARVLRNLKEQVYRLVQTDDPRGQLVQVADIDENSSADDLDVVFGVGARIQSKGLRGIDRWDLMDDVLKDPDLGLDSSSVLREVMPNIHSRVYVPMFKYLNDSGFLEKLLNNEEVALDDRVLKRYMKYVETFDQEQFLHLYSMDDLVKERGFNWVLDHALEVPKYTIDVDGIRTILVSQRWRRKSDRWSTGYGKLALVYDWMRYSRVG